MGPLSYAVRRPAPSAALLFASCLILVSCGGGGSSERDPYGDGGGYAGIYDDYDGFLDDFPSGNQGNGTGDGGGGLSPVPDPSGSDPQQPISPAELSLLMDALGGLSPQAKTQLQTLILDSWDSCSFLSASGGSNPANRYPCGSHSLQGCNSNVMGIGNRFLRTLLQRLTESGQFYVTAPVDQVIRDAQGVCAQTNPDNPAQFESRLEEAKRQCMQKDLGGCIRFGLLLVKTFLKALLGVLLGLR